MRQWAAEPERGRRLVVGAAALAAALLGTTGPCLAQANPSTGQVIESTTGSNGSVRTLSDPEDVGETVTTPGMDAVPDPLAGLSLYASPRAMFATTSSRVRSGPGTGHSPVGTIPYAGEVAVLGEAPGGDWVYLEMSDGTRGFTAAHLLSAARPTASTSTTGTTIGSDPSLPVCVSGQVLIDMGDGTSICATLQ